MDDKKTVYLVQPLGGPDYGVDFVAYYGVFTTWDEAVRVANEYENNTFTKPEEDGDYAEDIKRFEDGRWSSVRIVQMQLNKQYIII